VCENCKPTGKICPNCGADPCYHLCPNSVAYYSPEQERADEPWYGMDDNYERYAAERRDMELEAAAEAAYYGDTVSLTEDGEQFTNQAAKTLYTDIMSDDIPF
jgi:hypothetical protein